MTTLDIVRAFVPSKRTTSPITQVTCLLVPSRRQLDRLTALTIHHQMRETTTRREERQTLANGPIRSVTELIRSPTRLKVTSLRLKMATSIPTARLTQNTSLILSLTTLKQIRTTRKCAQFTNIEIQIMVNVNPTTPDLPQLEPLIRQQKNLLDRELAVCHATSQDGNKMEATQVLCLTNVRNTLTFWMVTTVVLPLNMPASSEAWESVLTARVTSVTVAAISSVPPAGLPLPAKTP